MEQGSGSKGGWVFHRGEQQSTRWATAADPVNCQMNRFSASGAEQQLLGIGAEHRRQILAVALQLLCRGQADAMKA